MANLRVEVGPRTRADVPDAWDLSDLLDLPDLLDLLDLLDLEDPSDLLKTSPSIFAVSLPVFVFCRLG